MNTIDRPAIVQLIQGSPEWLAYRLTRRNASESAAVLGLSPWMTPYQLWLSKTGREVSPVTPAMQRGTDLEPSARAAYEKETGLVMQPLVMEAGDYSASLDGMTLDGDLILEIKCPLRGKQSELWSDAARGEVPEHYQIQVQHQLMVSGAANAHLWVFDGQSGLLVGIDRDEELQERIRSAWDSFARHLEEDVAPPLSDGDTRFRGDHEWLSAAHHFVALKRQADELAERLEAARQALVGLAHHAKESGGGVAVTKYWKQGPVDYKKIPALSGVDLSRWRSPARQEVRVSVG